MQGHTEFLTHVLELLHNKLGNTIRPPCSPYISDDLIMLSILADVYTVLRCCASSVQLQSFTSAISFTAHCIGPLILIELMLQGLIRLPKKQSSRVVKFQFLRVLKQQLECILKQQCSCTLKQQFSHILREQISRIHVFDSRICSVPACLFVIESAPLTLHPRILSPFGSKLGSALSKRAVI